MESQKWNVDTLLALLVQEGCDVGEDNEGQIVLYTGYKQNENGELEKFESS